MTNISPFKAGVACFLNSTVTSYHWGCYGTSAMIQHKLQEAGYLVNSFPVEVTHESLPIRHAGKLRLERYGADLKSKNLTLYLAINEADIVVVNGEGTLHRSHAAPIHLLALIAYAKHIGKKVYLINHSCFPNGDDNPAPAVVEAYYKECLSKVDFVAAREPRSKKIYDRLGIDSVQAFDSLPLYIRNFVDVKGKGDGNVLVSAASNWTSVQCKQVSMAVRAAIGDAPASFLSGGYKRQPQEDTAHHAAMAPANIGLCSPESIDEWVNAIASAPLLITGRYHHYVAALCVGTPVILMPGNTPKSTAVAQWMGDSIHQPTDVDLTEKIKSALSSSLRISHLDLLADRAENNYLFLSK